MATDRAIGALCLGLAAAITATALLVGSSSTPPPARAGDASGPAGEAEVVAAFLEHVERAERTAWALDATWERRRGGEVVLTTAWRTVQDGDGNKLTDAFGNLRGTYDGRAVTCGTVDGVEQVCGAEAAPDDAGAASVASIEATAALTAPEGGDYVVTRAPARTILGEATACFSVRRRPGHAAGPFGDETTTCYSAASIPVLVERHEGLVVDTRTATAVSLQVDDLDFRELLDARAGALAAADLRSTP